ncbi:MULTISPECIES: RnfABCDGE type electron transport complex subunit B [Legionella]|uniref:RnfABCDGE type electron transport complex subunit B n=1 Tax=Legionella septentrionalis TaxID=2498109 RepID=A0A3S0XGQ7_9GAMM|nr:MULTISPECIES: RnfABCDGE type electron transport complex subunit B [Legionella]MCP0914854.1 RnfABCDGE type electron transport complex subunit B [Legionella sp. 27cVA30]RUQ88804.1 RnfABCDGE type electron transport complex subunit B [Legionella septentrionalis]RUR02918.1 RnfABCDGE type electron transport complex subunit B [Legionella septentrionalis]RUR11517.1 RnfABCDGE type electron transport complex subunit B [Legionella septentrionalis]RUR16782.1 RnfABCDGE type electron transport complex su
MVDVKDIDALLPQTQCGECSYAGCLPYAEALARGHASINRCPPGGVNTLQALGQLLRVDASPYMADMDANTRQPSVARIREDECIGCTKCINACPVDAIIGSGKLLHAVLSHECTGCGLCVEPCPVDCIDLLPLPEPAYNPEIARERHHARQVRLLREEHEKQQAYRDKKRLARQAADKEQDLQAKKEFILQALARKAQAG